MQIGNECQNVRARLRVEVSGRHVAVTVQVLRSSRQAIIPLWGDQIGLNASQVSLIFGASSAIEMVLFYPIGMLMDRRGRKWAAIPCLILLSVGMALVPLTSGFADLLLVGLLLGFAGLVASAIPAHRAASVDPMVALRQE